MKDKETLHKKIQEQIDCQATVDPLKEMSSLGRLENDDESALKWIALATLHGINMNAGRITIFKSGMDVKVTAEYRPAELPSPGVNIGEKIIEDFRRIIHLEGDRGKTTLAMGIRNASIDMGVEISKDKTGEKVIIDFP